MSIRKLEQNDLIRTDDSSAKITVDMADPKVNSCGRHRLHDDAEYLSLPDCYNGPPRQVDKLTGGHQKDEQDRYPSMVSIDDLLWALPVDRTKSSPPPVRKQPSSLSAKDRSNAFTEPPLTSAPGNGDSLSRPDATRTAQTAASSDDSRTVGLSQSNGAGYVRSDYSQAGRGSDKRRFTPPPVSNWSPLAQDSEKPGEKNISASGPVNGSDAASIPKKPAKQIFPWEASRD